MRALKALIVGMGILLVIGFGILGVMIFRKFQNEDQPQTSVPHELVLPQGFEVVDIMDLSGQLLIHLKSFTKEDQIIIVDLHSGQEVIRFVTPRSESR